MPNFKSCTGSKPHSGLWKNGEGERVGELYTLSRMLYKSAFAHILLSRRCSYSVSSEKVGIDEAIIDIVAHKNKPPSVSYIPSF